VDTECTGAGDSGFSNGAISHGFQVLRKESILVKLGNTGFMNKWENGTYVGLCTTLSMVEGVKWRRVRWSLSSSVKTPWAAKVLA